jgi:ABC-type multidrug transport system ATPase subunit
VHIEARELVKQYTWTKALDGLSWNLGLGRIAAVLGPNGAGKTTLLNALSGSVLLDGGRVLMDGQALTPERADLRRRYAFIPDAPPVPGGWTPLRFIGSVLRLYETPEAGLEEKVLGILERLDLLGVARWRFHQLSRGQAYKAVLAAFLAADPEVWFVDEPFASGMDPRGLNCFKEYAREAAARGHTIVFTTQIVEVAEALANEICVLDHGKIQLCAGTEGLENDPAFKSLLAQLRESPTA